jgi:hypothetical protein
VVQVATPDPVNRSAPRAGDRWADKHGDEWLVSWSDQGPQFRLCHGEGPPPARAKNRPAHYVVAEYGPLRLRHRAGRQILVDVQLEMPK